MLGCASECNGLWKTRQQRGKRKRDRQGNRDTARGSERESKKVKNSRSNTLVCTFIVLSEMQETRQESQVPISGQIFCLTFNQLFVVFTRHLGVSCLLLVRPSPHTSHFGQPRFAHCVCLIERRGSNRATEQHSGSAMLFISLFIIPWEYGFHGVIWCSIFCVSVTAAH